MLSWHGGGGTGTYLSFRCNVGTVDVGRGQKEGAYLSYMRSAGTRDESRLPTERPPSPHAPSSSGYAQKAVLREKHSPLRQSAHWSSILTRAFGKERVKRKKEVERERE